MKKIMLLMAFLALSFVSKTQEIIWSFQLESNYIYASPSNTNFTHHIIEFRDTSKIIISSDTLQWDGLTFLKSDILNARTSYGWGNHSGLYKLNSYTPSWSEITSKPSFFFGSYTDLTNKPTIPTNTNQLTNGSGFITSEVDGSITNEIELPSQTGNSGKVLQTNGSATSWVTETNPVTYYNASGTISVTKKWIATVTPSTGNGYSIDISSAGFSNVLGVSVVPVKNTATATSVPKIGIKSMTSSAIVINIIEGNASLVTLLGVSVLSGASEQFVNTTGLTLLVTV